MAFLEVQWFYAFSNFSDFSHINYKKRICGFIIKLVKSSQCTCVFNDSSTSAWKWKLKDFKCCQSQCENAFLWRPSAFEFKHHCPRLQGLHYVCYSLNFGIHDDWLYCQGWFLGHEVPTHLPHVRIEDERAIKLK